MSLPGLLGAGGLLRVCFPAWRRYFRADFHPGEQSSQRSAAWLSAHAVLFQPVNSGA